MPTWTRQPSEAGNVYKDENGRIAAFIAGFQDFTWDPLYNNAVDADTLREVIKAYVSKSVRKGQSFDAWRQEIATLVTP